MQARHRIRPHWFVDPIAGKIWATKIKFFEEFQRIPSVEELKEWGDFVTEEPQISKKMLHKVQIGLLETQNFGKDALTRELQGWLQAILFKESAITAQNLFNKQKFDECFSFFGKQLDHIKTTKFVEDQEFQFEDYATDFEKEVLDREKACTFGSTLIDSYLLPEATQGSLLPGDQTILLAPTNIGKTTAILTIVAANLRKGRSVLLLTHEGRPQDINLKLWCNLLQVTRPELFKMMQSVEGKARLDQALAVLKKYLTYVPYTKAGMVVEDVETIIRSKQEERIAKTGKGYDMLACDYPAKLTTRMASHGNMAPRHIMDIVYNYFVNLALEYSFHSLVAIQANRDASRVNRGQREEGRLLTPEDVSEAFGPMQTATNIISINRDPIAAGRDLLTYYIAKSRSSEVGWAFICKSNFKYATTHSNKLGAVGYRGSHSMVEAAETYMQQYLNSVIPETPHPH